MCFCREHTVVDVSVYVCVHDAGESIGLPGHAECIDQRHKQLQVRRQLSVFLHLLFGLALDSHVSLIAYITNYISSVLV